VDELAPLERARADLRSGRPVDALFSIDLYERNFSPGTFDQEAVVLRIEALLQAGERTKAASIGSQFLASHPTSPHAARVRTLLSPSNR
jgi:outer membrane protein assembly factor BamD (BamD/ComL family)